MKISHLRDALKIYEEAILFIEKESYDRNRILEYLILRKIQFGLCNLFAETYHESIFRRKIIQGYLKYFRQPFSEEDDTAYFATPPMWGKSKQEVLESLKIRYFVLLWEITFRITKFSPK